MAYTEINSEDRLVLSLALLSQTRTGLALALEVLNRVFERHAVTLEERFQVAPRRNVEELTQFQARHAVRSVRFRGERLERCAGHVAIPASELFGQRVGHVKPDLHVSDDTAGRRGTAILERRIQPMSRPSTSQLPDAAMQGVDAALLRAAQQAREIARQTGTAIVIVRDGVLVEERCDGADAPAPTPLSSGRLVEGDRT